MSNITLQANCADVVDFRAWTHAESISLGPFLLSLSGTGHGAQHTLIYPDMAFLKSPVRAFSLTYSTARFIALMFHYYHTSPTYLPAMPYLDSRTSLLSISASLGPTNHSY